MIPPGARLEAWAPSQAPGTAPMRSEEATVKEKSPKMRWPTAAAATSGTAWARSVPTSWDALRAGYMRRRTTMMTEPAPTDVMPTMNPATAPRTTVGRGRTTRRRGRVGRAGPSPRGSRLRHICSTARTTRPVVAVRRATPRMLFRTPSRSRSAGSVLTNQAPANAAGIEPRQSQPTSRSSTVPWRRWTAAPAGFMSRLTTMSLEIAVSGLTLKTKTSMGVISAPPPIPVRPTIMPTSRPAIASGASKVIGPATPARERIACRT